MRTVFDEKLAEIHRDFLQLGVMVNEAIYKSVKALVNHDAELAQEVIDGDSEINEKENQIDTKCYEIIALQQPNTTDLRRVLAVMRASSDLERMADHAQNISEVTINVKGKRRDQNLEQRISKIGDLINAMCSDIIDSFVDYDVHKAKEVAKRDKEVEKGCQELRLETLQVMKADTDAIFSSVDYSFVGMHLERIGDYVKNIAEWIVYLETGNIVDLD